MSSAKRRRVGTLTASTSHPEIAAMSTATAKRRRVGTCGLTASTSHPQPAMSSAKRRRRVGTCRHGTTTGVDLAEPPHIPDDILIEIFARSDAKTTVRAAATSKPIRRAILSPDFRRRRRRHAGRATGRSGFDPDLLLGASCMFCTWPRDAFFQEQRHPFTFETESLGWLDPMVSRGCLVVLHRRSTISADLRVVNTLTGRVTRVRSPNISAMYPRTLLAVGDAGRSFELLVADTDLVTRVFSSERGDWGDVVRTRLPRNFINTLPHRCSPALVLGGTTVHWLCREQCIVALDVTTASATVIELPPGCFSQVARCPKHTDKGLLASSADGRLGLLVARSGGISMWSLSSASAPAAARWTLQVVVQRPAVARQRPGCAVRLLRFGEWSGAVMLQVGGVGLVQIDLGSREARVLSDEFKEIGKYPYSGLQLCLHETDQPTLLESAIKNMKHF